VLESLSLTRFAIGSRTNPTPSTTTAIRLVGRSGFRFDDPADGILSATVKNGRELNGLEFRVVRA